MGVECTVQWAVDRKVKCTDRQCAYLKQTQVMTLHTYLKPLWWTASVGGGQNEFKPAYAIITCACTDLKAKRQSVT